MNNLFNKLNPFKKQEQVPRRESVSVEEDVILPISDAEFKHKIGMLSLGKNQYLTEIGRTEFVDGINNAIENGNIAQEQVLRDLKNLQGMEFYEKYKDLNQENPYKNAVKKMRTTGFFSFTAQDHEDMGSTPDSILIDHPGKAQYELMSEEEIQAILDNVEIVKKDPQLVKNGYYKNLVDAIKVDIPFLKSVGKLPKKYEDFDVSQL
jgi:hypothetical protein